MPLIPAIQEVAVGGWWSKACPDQKHGTVSEKQTKSKKIGGTAQVVECFQLKALSSTSVLPKKG
jgi:hypothetical protein